MKESLAKQQWSEAIASEKLPDLPACLAAAGVFHKITIGTVLYEHYGWSDGTPLGQERYDIAHLVSLALTGLWPCQKLQTLRGEALLFGFPCFVRENSQVVDLQLAVVIGDNELYLTHPKEFDEPQVQRTCLLAEVEPVLARLMCILLKRSHFSVTHTADGHEAWHLAQTRRFCIAVLDIDLPGMGGVELCHHIKATPELIMPVVLCSDRADLPQAAKQAEADAYIEKPCGLLKMASQLHCLLDQRNPPARTPASSKF